MIGGGRQRVLIGACVDRCVRQLLRGGIGKSSDRHVGGGQTTDLPHAAGDPEIGEQDSAFAVLGRTEQDVGGFDVPM